MKLSKSLKTILGVIAALGLISTARAVPITGMLNISGTATFDSVELENAHSATFSDVTVAGGNTGVFADTTIFKPGITPVLMAAYTFNPSTVTNGLWSVGGFTFNLTSSHIDLQSASFLNISGVGIVTGPPGFDPTPGVWAFSSQSPGGLDHDTFSFSATTDSHAGVPDNGMTAMLLGAGLVGLAAFGWKFAKTAKA